MSDWKLGPAVADGKLRFLSVSAIEKFDDRAEFGCKMRWWMRYCAKKPEPQTKAQDIGVELHAQCAKYLTEGVDGFGTIGRSGKGFLEQLRPYVLGVEYKLEHLNEAGDTILPDSYGIAGVPLLGSIDCVARQNSLLWLWDWKTTSDIVKYAKTPQQLIKSVQLIGYTDFLRKRGIGKYIYEFPIHIGHGYFQTKSPSRFEPRTASFARPMHEQAMHEVEQVVENMKSVAAEKVPDNIPGHGSACFAYGKRCPHFDYCPKRKSEEVTKMSFASMLKKAATAAPKEAKPETAAILPPDAPKSNPAAVETKPAKEHKLAKIVDDDRNTVDPKATAPQTVERPKLADDGGPLIPPPRAEAGDAEPKKGPGRPKGSPNKPKETPAPPPDVASGPKVVSVHYSNGITLKMATQFEMARFDVGVTVACLDSDKDKAYELAKAEVEKKLNADVEEFLAEREKAAEIKAV